MSYFPEGQARGNPLARETSDRPVDRYDISNRPAGDTSLRTNTDLTDLENLTLLITSIDMGLPIDQDFVDACKLAIVKLLHDAKTVYRGRHPLDIMIEGDPNPRSLYDALDVLRKNAESQFKMPKACTPFRPARPSTGKGPRNKRGSNGV